MTKKIIFFLFLFFTIFIIFIFAEIVFQKYKFILSWVHFLKENEPLIFYLRHSEFIIQYFEFMEKIMLEGRWVFAAAVKNWWKMVDGILSYLNENEVAIEQLKLNNLERHHSELQRNSNCWSTKFLKLVKERVTRDAEAIWFPLYTNIPILNNKTI